MDQYKREFINFLLKSGALRIGGETKLKSGRLSPYFVNIGDFNTGSTTTKLCEAYAHAIKPHADRFDLIYGIPEKGVGLAIGTAMELARIDVDKPWFFTRKFEKTHGDVSQFVGRKPADGERVLQLDDVFTAGTAKYEARDDLLKRAKVELPLLAIAVDRQEVGVDGESAISKYEDETGTLVISIVNASEILAYVRERPEILHSVGADAVQRMENYLRVYGTAQARKGVPWPDQTIIGRDRSIIPACDIPRIEQFEELVKQTADVEGVGGYKLGFELGLTYGLPRLVETARKHTDKPLIYDHQKAGTDIPDTGKNFARVCKQAGLDAVIFFPQAGPETERAWIYHALDQGLKMIVGGRMTHPAYARSEGGFISDEGALEMYRIAARAGINHFVVPGNKTDVIAQVKTLVEAEGVKPIFYAPGFVAQGGSITDAAKVAGSRWHAIVGRGITEAKGADYRAAALAHTGQL